MNAQPMDGVSTIALLVLVAFVIERIASAALFFLVSVGALRDTAAAETGALRAGIERRHQWWRFAISALLTVAVMALWPELRVLKFFPQESYRARLDDVMTWVVLLGGAAQIGAMVKLPGGGAPARPAAPPLQVTGTLKLDDARSRD